MPLPLLQSTVVFNAQPEVQTALRQMTKLEGRCTHNESIVPETRRPFSDSHIVQIYTVGVTGFGPVRLLTGRNLRTRLLQDDTLLGAKVACPRQRQVPRQGGDRCQKKDFNLRHAVFPTLQLGDTPWF